MDGQTNNYPRKTGLVLSYIIVPTLVVKLTVEKVNNESGAYLHQFKW